MESSKSESQFEWPQSDLYLSKGLSGQDERFDYLISLFEQLQLATVETSNPDLDLATFAEVACYFAVIMKRNKAKQEELENSPSSDYKVGNMLNPEEESLKTFFEPQQKGLWYGVDYAKGQIMNTTNEGLIGTTSKFPDPFVEAADNHQQTSQNFRSDPNDAQLPHHDLPLYGSNIPEYEMDGHFANISMSRDEAIGLVYLVNLADTTGDCLRNREFNIGIILEPLHRGQGYAHQAIEMVLEVAFEVEKCHRVQAILPDHIAKDRAICFFTQMRFDHEGTRRRAFFSRMERVYKDVTYMAILDTDWMLRQTNRKRTQKSGRPAPKSVWDELLSRHQREREELLNWEAGIRYSRTLRPRARTPTQSCFRAVEANDDNDDDEMLIDIALSMREPKAGEIRSKTLPRGRENDPFGSSTDSDANSEHSASSDGYFGATSSSASAWDVVEPSDLDSDEAEFEFVG